MAEHHPQRPAPRIATRAAIDFMVRSARAIAETFDGDLPGGLALLALMRAQYPLIDARKPLERPVAVQSMARSLKIPAETMRRSINRLVERGWCRRIDMRGVTLSEEALGSGEVTALIKTIREEFGRMIVGLKSIGFDFDIMDRASEEEVTLPDLAAVDAGKPVTGDIDSGAFDAPILDFMLRFVDGGLAPHDDNYVRSYVFATIMSANAAPFTLNPEIAWRYAGHDTPPPDEMRRPISLSELSQLLVMPYETTRRYVNSLIEMGHCVRDENKGITVPTSVTQAPEVLKSGIEITRRFAQTIGELKRCGFDFRAVAVSSAVRNFELPERGEDGAA